MDTPALTNEMKLVLHVLRQSVVAASQEFEQRRRALDIYSKQCGEQLGIELDEWTLNLETLTFTERHGKS